MTDALARSGNSWLIAPRDMSEVYRFAETLARSDLAPKDFRGKPDNVIVAIQYGAEVGLSPMQSIQSVAVINGRPAMWGDAMLALVLSHPSVKYYNETFDEATQTGRSELHRDRLGTGNLEKTVNTFSMNDAQRAKLANKAGPWTEYPKRMCKLRARGFTLRDGAADILRGMASREEMEDIQAVVVMDAPRNALPVQSSEPQKPALPPSPPAQPANTQQPASKPLPTKTTAKYPEKQWADAPFSSLPHSALTAYVAYYRSKLSPDLQANHRQAIEATIQKAEYELQLRLDEEANSAAAMDEDDIPSDDEGSTNPLQPLDPPSAFDPQMVEYADPETGEVRHARSDSLEGQLALSIDAKGIDRTDPNDSWGLSDGQPTKAVEKRTQRKGAANDR